MRAIAFAATIALAAPLHAQSETRTSGGDTITVDSVSQFEATVTYQNDAGLNSLPAEFVMMAGDIRLEVRIDITKGPEIITVTPPDGFVAMPPVAEVIDGEGVVIRILPAMF